MPPLKSLMVVEILNNDVIFILKLIQFILSLKQITAGV